MLICILTKNVITSCSVTMMLFLHLEVKPLMTLTTVLYLSCALISDRKSGSAGMPRPISYAVFCLKKKKNQNQHYTYLPEQLYFNFSHVSPSIPNPHRYIRIV